MKKNNFSKEYIFNECESHKHCLGLELSKPFSLNNKQHYHIYVLGVEPNREDKKELLTKNCIQQTDSYGELSLLAYVEGMSIQDAIVINIDTSDIIEVNLVRD